MMYTISKFTNLLNQSILKEVNIEYSLEGLKQKLQYFGQMSLKKGETQKYV